MSFDSTRGMGAALDGTVGGQRQFHLLWRQVLGGISAEEHANIFLDEPGTVIGPKDHACVKHNGGSESGSTAKMAGSKRTVSEPFRFEANLGRLRFVQLGSILAPIKRTKSGRFSELCLAESTDSPG